MLKDIGLDDAKEPYFHIIMIKEPKIFIMEFYFSLQSMDAYRD